MKFCADGPAVMLCDYTSIFPAQLATYWRSKGMEVVLVTDHKDAPPSLPDGTRIVRGCEYETPLNRTVARRLMAPIVYRLENRVPRFKKKFTQATGASTETQLWMPNFASFLTGAWPLSRAALAQRPRFVFGHEAISYGPATALCRGVPRIIFPWGGDVYAYAEASPYHFAMTKYSLRAVDLIVPSSTIGARHIRERFGVPAEKVQAVSWGVDRRLFHRADNSTRDSLCAKWGIDPAAKVFLNARRFRPIWGAFLALDAFMRLAAEQPATHFILLGGLHTEEFTREARARLEAAGMLSRFTLLEGDAPLETCAELMSISDVFVSLMGLGDMRSVSVLQATAAGGIPVISDVPEYREMERVGFAALFVKPDDAEDVLAALRFCMNNASEVNAMRARNNDYIVEHEDYTKQMDKMLDLIDKVCKRYGR